MADKARCGDFAPSSGRWMSALKDPLDKTWNILTNSPNRAAVAVLVSALKSRHRFASFSEMDQAALAEAVQKSAHHMKSALHDAVLDEQIDLCENACHVILIGKVYDALPTLVKAAENRIRGSVTSG